MLPNHAPYVIAEQFGTLARLFPGRIDLGLGRAPGTDQITLRALRRPPEAAETLPAGRARIAGVPRAGRARSAHPGGSGGGHASAALDSRLEPFRRDARRRTRPALCLRLAFRARSADAGAPDLSQPVQAVRTAARPYAMVGVNIIAAETDAEARRLATTQQMSFANIFRGARGLSQPPIDDIETYWSPMEKAQAKRMLARCDLSARPKRCAPASRLWSRRPEPTNSSSSPTSTTIRAPALVRADREGGDLLRKD